MSRCGDPIAPADIDAVRTLATAAEASDRRPPFGDAVWRDLAPPDPAVDARHRGVGRRSPSAPSISRPTGEPRRIGADRRDRDRAAAPWRRRRAGARRDGARRRDRSRGSRILLWIFGADDTADAVRGRIGIPPERELRQMRVPLPLTEHRGWPPGVDVRPFRPGVDDETWLSVNNRAFADDPDQGGWTLDDAATARGRSRGSIRPGSCSLDDDAPRRLLLDQVHPAAPPHEPEVLGEIYVIGVDPDHQGIGLGRALVAGGLASLHERACRRRDAVRRRGEHRRRRAVRALGFRVIRIDRAYGRDAR